MSTSWAYNYHLGGHTTGLRTPSCNGPLGDIMNFYKDSSEYSLASIQ